MGLKNLIIRIRRVLTIATKPESKEYIQSFKITGIGILIIGILGLVIFLLVQLVGGL